ncbi:MAG: hypothetical protein ACRDPM_17980 [Solirubrobacteraceae bacterium]
MNLNRDEFLLLSRTGRGTYSTRAGPGPDERFEAGLTARRLRRRARSGLTLRRDGLGLRHVLGPRSGQSTRVSRTQSHPDEGTYFEMEFAVGFPAEEETLL